MRPPVVIFDFDGTLTSRDSLIDFSLRYCLARPARFLFVIPLLPVALLLLTTRSQAAAGSVLLWAMTLGVSTRSFVLALRSYASHTLPDYAFDAVFDELAGHVREGRRVLIATGSLPVLVRGLLAARQLGRLPTVGTRVRRRLAAKSRHALSGDVKVEGCSVASVCSVENLLHQQLRGPSAMSGAADITLVCPTGARCD